MRPCDSCNWVLLSLTLSSVTSEPPSMRTDAPPTCSSSRAPLSAHTRSPETSGRLTGACSQLVSPAGEKLTAPLAYDRLAARAGGSAYAEVLRPSAAATHSAIRVRRGVV